MFALASAVVWFVLAAQAAAHDPARDGARAQKAAGCEPEKGAVKTSAADRRTLSRRRAKGSARPPGRLELLRPECPTTAQRHVPGAY